MRRIRPKRFDCPQCGARSGKRCVSDHDPTRIMSTGYHEARRRVAAGEELPVGDYDPLRRHLRALLLEFCGPLKFSADERQLADNFEQLLRADGVDYVREYALDAHDRLDFLIHESVGVEIKTAGSYNTVLRQLGRYAQHERVEVLLLVTTRSNHQKMPTALGGKPLIVHWVPFCA